MGRSSRKLRRRAARRPSAPMLREVAPGVYDLALPLPPGMPPDEVAAAVADFRERVRRELGIEVAAVHACNPATCPHHARR